MTPRRGRLDERYFLDLAKGCLIIFALVVIGSIAVGIFAHLVSDANDYHRIEQREMQR